MKNRAIWVGLGLLLAVAATIVWALTRFHATALEHAQAAAVEKAASPQTIVVLDAPAPASPVESAAIADAEGDEAPAAAAGAARDSRTSALAKEISLHGVVTDARGVPLGIDPQPDDQGIGRDSIRDDRLVRVETRGSRFRSEIDEHGGYSITGLHEGTWTVYVKLKGYRPWRTRLQLSDAESERRFDIALEPEGIFHVRIEVALDDVPEEASIANAEFLNQLVHDCEEQDTLQVLVTKEPQRSKWDAEVVRNIGHWIGREHDHPEEHDGRSTWVMRRTIRVPDGLPVHASVVVGDVVLRSEQVHVQDQEVTFFLTPAQITSCLGGVRFLVVDEEGRASGAMPALRFFRATSAVGGEFVLRCREFGDASTTSTASGEIRIESLHPGSLGIEVQQPGFAKARLETVVDPGLIRDLGVVRLARDRAIRGHVVNIDGSPASAEVECSALRSTNQGPPPFQPETRETDSPGGFVFYHAAPGIYVLRARGSLQASCATAVVSTESGSVDGIVLRLQPASHVEFRVERPPTSAVVLCIDDSHGQPVRQAGMIVDEKGVYDSADLASGKYTARAISRGDVVATAEFRVSNGALRVRLTPP